ncbi:MAG TPA: hypothetical protein VF954_03760 [Acidimicrobiales bacterium]
MPGAASGSRSADHHSLSALPSVRARVAAFVAIVAAGGFGGLIGYGFAGVQCRAGCTNGKGVGLLVGGVIASAGVAVVSVLVLRAMGEWRTIRESAGPGPGAKGPPGGRV